jgi:hypothetical protein
MPAALPDHTMAVIFHQLFDLDRGVQWIAKEHGVTPRMVRKWRLNWNLFCTPWPPKGILQKGPATDLHASTGAGPHSSYKRRSDHLSP